MQTLANLFIHLLCWHNGKLGSLTLLSKKFLGYLNSLTNTSLLCNDTCATEQQRNQWHILRNGLMYSIPKPYILLRKTIHFTQQNHTFYSAKPYILLSKTIHFTQQNHTFYLAKPYILLLNRLTNTSIWINNTRVFGYCPGRESWRYNRESLCQALMRGERREAVCWRHTADHKT